MQEGIDLCLKAIRRQNIIICGLVVRVVGMGCWCGSLAWVVGVGCRCGWLVLVVRFNVCECCVAL